MLGSGVGPMSFLGIPKSKRRDRCASAPQRWVVPANSARPPRQNVILRYNGAIVRTVRPSRNLKYVGCDLVTLLLGYLMLFGGFAGVGFFCFALEMVPSHLRPVAAVPAAAVVAGVICIVMATVSAKRKATRLSQNVHVAPRQAQSARIHSFTPTTNTGTASCRSGRRNSRSDNVRCTQSSEARYNYTRTVSVNGAMGCTPTIYSVHCSDNAPPSYEAVTENSIGSTRF